MFVNVRVQTYCKAAICDIVFYGFLIKWETFRQSYNEQNNKDNKNWKKDLRLRAGVDPKQRKISTHIMLYGNGAYKFKPFLRPLLHGCVKLSLF